MRWMGRLLSAEECTKLVAPGVQICAGAIGCYSRTFRSTSKWWPSEFRWHWFWKTTRLNPEFVKILASGSKSLGFDYCFLDSDDHNDKVDILLRPGRCGRDLQGSPGQPPVNGPQTTHAYMITLAGAEKACRPPSRSRSPSTLRSPALPHRVQGHRHAQDGMGQRRQLGVPTSDRSVAADS